jgi:hypothetical protein
MATPAHTIELAPRSDGARYRRVTLAVEADGSVSLSSLDVSDASLAAWGLGAEELTLTVAREDVGRLALALAAEILAGGAEAVPRLREICERQGVSCRVTEWS